MKKALGYHPDAEVVFFLGDGISDLEDIKGESPFAIIAVKGNCDPSLSFTARDYQKVESITLEGKKIVLTHGDLYGAKYGDAGLEALAESRGTDILLFGHTHIPYLRYVNTEEKYIWKKLELKDKN